MRLFILCCIVLASLVNAQTAPQPDTQNLRIAIRVLEPFVIERSKSYTGFSIELWQTIAERNKWRFEWERKANVREMLSAVTAGQADVAITAISMTQERERVLDFSLPMFNSGLQIMVPSQRGFSIEQALEGIFSPQLAFVAGLMLLTILLAGHAIWLIERRRDSSFPKGYWAGIWEGIWWAALNLTSSSIGERTPKSVIGRLLAMVWIFLGIVLLANFTAAVTTNLTLREIRGTVNNISDLPGKRVLAVANTTSSQYLIDNNIRHQTISTLQEGFARLENRQADAMIYDAPVLNYYAANLGGGRVRTVGNIFKQEYYGIALPTGSPLREPINRSLIELISDGTMQQIYDKYFKQSRN